MRHNCQKPPCSIRLQKSRKWLFRRLTELCHGRFKQSNKSRNKSVRQVAPILLKPNSWMLKLRRNRVKENVSARAIAWQFRCRLFLRTWMSSLTPNPQGEGPRLCHMLAIFCSHLAAKMFLWPFIMDAFCLEPVPGVPHVLNANAGLFPFYRFDRKSYD